MAILITGHRGYIGSALKEYLHQHLSDDNIIGYDIVDGDDILNYERLARVMKENTVRLVIHLAALSSVTACNENPAEAKRINGYGTEVVLKAMQSANCVHIIYASTSSVYGNQEELPYHERMNTQPCSPYGESKLQGEKVIQEYYRKGVIVGSYLIFRMFNVVGTSGVPHVDKRVSAGYDRLFAALESGHITIYGSDFPTADGTGERDYVALKDVCHAYLLGIKAINENPHLREVVNISKGEPTSVQKIITIWNSITETIDGYNKLPKLTYQYGDRRSGDPARVYGQNSHAKDVLGWMPTRKIDDIIRDLAIDRNVRHG